MIPMLDPQPTIPIGSPYPMNGGFFAEDHHVSPEQAHTCPACGTRFRLKNGRAFPTLYKCNGADIYGMLVFCSNACVLRFLDNDAECGHA